MSLLKFVVVSCLLLHFAGEFIECRDLSARRNERTNSQYYRVNNGQNQPQGLFYRTTTTTQSPFLDYYGKVSIGSDFYSNSGAKSGNVNVPNARPVARNQKAPNKRKAEENEDRSKPVAPVNSPIIEKPPLSLILAMSNITNLQEFQRRFGLQEPKLLQSSIYSGAARVAPELRERNLGNSVIPFAPPATCSPQPTTVPIELGGNPYDVFFPSCTRLERCGGCCSHDLLECAASKTEEVEFQVLKTKYLGPPLNRFDTGEMITVKLERHKECQCQCRVKQSDCLYGLQIYKANECRCECTNQDELKNCVGEKVWDPSICSCKCREYIECSTNFNFNPETCRCETTRVSRMGFGPGFRDI